MSWYDGCNACYLGEIKTQYKSNVTNIEFTASRYSINNGTCTEMYCYKNEKPKCT